MIEKKHRWLTIVDGNGGKWPEWTAMMNSVIVLLRLMFSSSWGLCL